MEQRAAVEGHINRLKILKRQMYGRAGIELLRARLLLEPEFSDPIMLHQNCVRTVLTEIDTHIATG